MSEPRGSRRGIYAAAAAALFTAIGVVALVLGFSGDSTPPEPTAAQAGSAGSRPMVGDRVPAAADSVPASPGHTSSPTPMPQGPVLTRSRPVHLDIDAIGVHTSLLQLGLNHDGSLQVPWKPLLAGWFSHSPTPGQRGPSVIAGHVDSWETGPAVFYRLGSLSPGATVTVTRADGSMAAFRVDGVREYPKAHFPTVPVYGNTDRAELRLITCGNWNSSRQEYDGNVVVFAHLVPGSRS